jgi:hypothetical protein
MQAYGIRVDGLDGGIGRHFLMHERPVAWLEYCLLM